MSFMPSDSETASWLQRLLQTVGGPGGAPPGPPDPITALQDDLARQARLPKYGGLFGGDYARYMAARAGAPQTLDGSGAAAPAPSYGAFSGPLLHDAVLRASDPQASAVPVAARGPVQEAAARPAAAPSPPQVDPNTTDVFQPGPDGKLHPVPGWHTTGPFDVGQWAHNIDWGAVGRDLALASAGIGGIGLEAPMTALKAAGILGGLTTAGFETKHELDKAVEPNSGQGRRRR